jgi:SAM-dependent methyltransferase
MTPEEKSRDQRRFKKVLSWEEKAQINPLYAVMSTSDFEDKSGAEITDADLIKFMEKGDLLFRRHFEPLLSTIGLLGSQKLAIEYGCGMGRLMRQFIGAGMRCAGIDISATMLEHAKRLVPEADSLHLMDATNRTPLSDGCADFVYSYAVLQHINRFSVYKAAIAEMCRLLKPGGWIRIQINADDSPFNRLNHEGNLSIETFEDHVVRRYRDIPDRAGEKREFNHWSGVDIGFPAIERLLNEHNVEILGYEHYPPKPRACWVTGKKS